MSVENLQLKKLVDAGLTPAEAAESLGIPCEGAALALQSSSGSERMVTVEELIAKYKPEAINTLVGILRYGESETAKVAAAKIILEGQGQLPEIQASKIREMMDKMARQSAMAKARVIDITPAAKDTKVSDIIEETTATMDNCMAGAI